MSKTRTKFSSKGEQEPCSHDQDFLSRGVTKLRKLLYWAIYNQRYFYRLLNWLDLCFSEREKIKLQMIITVAVLALAGVGLGEVEEAERQSEQKEKRGLCHP